MIAGDDYLIIISWSSFNSHEMAGVVMVMFSYAKPKRRDTQISFTLPYVDLDLILHFSLFF